MSDTATSDERSAQGHHLGELLQDLDTAMLVTRSPSGGYHATPLHLAEVEERSHRLTFVTADDSRKVEAVLSHPLVCVIFQSENLFLSLYGLAHVERNAERTRELWRPSMALWYDNPEDPRLALLVVEVRRGEYWDRAGLRGLRFLARAGRALIEGETLADDLDATHAEVRR